MALTKASQNVITPNIATTDTAQTISGVKTFSKNQIVSLAATETATALEIKNLGSGLALSISDEVTETTPFVVDASGKCGVKIAVPLYDLHVGGTFFPSTGTVGITNGIAATTGIVGQILTNTSAVVSILSNVKTAGATVTLTAGDWEVYSNATFNFTGVTATLVDQIGAAVSNANNTMPTNQCQWLLTPVMATAVTQTPAYAFVTPRVRFNVTVNTPVYVVVQAPLITAGTMTFTSIITANRVR